MIGIDNGIMDPLHPDPDRIALAGDWHGNALWATRMIQSIHQEGVKVVVHLGDFGFWTDCDETTTYLQRVQKALTKNDMWLFWVDGNHEDHSRLITLPIDTATGLRPIPGYDRIIHLPRGFRWTWQGRVWMALGGAHSVDRRDRKEFVSWWPDEFLSASQVHYALREDDPVAPGPVQIMVCHDAPDKADIPAIRGTSSWPTQELVMSARHREIIGEVVEQLKPVALFHGHYHCKYKDIVLTDNGKNRTFVRGLACDQTSYQDNILILDLNKSPV